MVLLLPPCLLIRLLSSDPCHCHEVHVPHLDLGVAPSLRKKVDLVPFVVPVVAHHLSLDSSLQLSEPHFHLYHLNQLALLVSH